MTKEANPCPLCGALPCDWVDNPHMAEVGLCWTLAEIREVLCVGEKPMLGDLPGIVRDRLTTLRTAVMIAADQFALYGRLHRAKGTKDGDDKASVNEQFAAEMRAALKRSRTAPTP